MKFISLMVVGLSLSLSALAAPYANPERWQGFSAPQIMGSGFTHSLSALPLEGSMQIGPRAWSGHYWPTRKGGINYRWNAPKKEGFDYESPTREEAFHMTEAELATLSASEKYDLYLGRYDYPLKAAAASRANRFASDWSGICHGWAPATLHHSEPTSKVVTNPDGLKIPFGSSDIKALVSYYYANHAKTDSGQMGLRCFFGRWLGGARGCNEDLNAGAFHIVMTNKMGLQKEGFVLDIDRYREVWNQPAVAYKSTILSQEAPDALKSAETAVKRLKVATTLFYVDEADPTWDIVHGTKDQKIVPAEYTYYVELDYAGNIVGGEWISGTRPDFIWFKEKEKEFSGVLSELPKLLND